MIDYMNACRSAKSKGQVAEDRQTSNSAVREYVNEGMLRGGDLLQNQSVESQANERYYHPDQYTTMGILRQAFAYIGTKERALGNTGVSESTHSLRSAMSVSTIALKAFEAHAAAKLNERQYDAACIIKGYDLTPSVMRFGRLASTFAPSARYFIVRTDDPTKWTSVSLEDFRKNHGKQNAWMPMYGTLDILAQEQELHLQYIDEDGKQVSVPVAVPIPPRICLDGTASTVYGGVNNALKHTSMESIIEMAGKSKFVWLRALRSHFGSSFGFS